MIKNHAPIIAGPDGARIGGINYPAGYDITQAIQYRDRVRDVQQVAQYNRIMEASSRPMDPAAPVSTVAPNVGRFVLPHVITFRGLLTSLSKAYKIADTALLHRPEYAEMMRQDDAVMGPIFSRQRSVALLNWSVDCEDDPDNPNVKAVARETESIIRRMRPGFTEYKRAMGESIWYGRCANQHRFGTFYDSNGKRRYNVKQWTPIHGDKLLFRYDDGTGTYDPDQIGIRVSPVLGRKDSIAGARELEYTPEGVGYFLQPWERSLVAVHKHLSCDASWETPQLGASIHGTGIRHFIYWTWYAKQECMAQLINMIDRTAHGVTVYRYPVGNPKAHDEMRAVAEQQAHDNVIVLPTDPEDPDAYSIEVIPLTTGGLDQLQNLIYNYFNDQLTRFILGQTLSTKSDATGLGSGVADLHHDSLMQVLRYDAESLEDFLGTP